MTAPESLASIAKRHDLGLVVLFGSRARRVARIDSDIDLGVLHAQGRRLAPDELANAVWELGGCFDGLIDVADLATDDAIFRLAVARDGKVLFADHQQRWSDFVARALIDHADIAYPVALCVAGVKRAAAAL